MSEAIKARIERVKGNILNDVSADMVNDVLWLCTSLLTAIEALERIKLTGFSDHVKLRQTASEGLAKIGASDV